MKRILLRIGIHALAIYTALCLLLDAPRIQAPTQILVAERDELIPRDSTLALWRAFPPGVARIRIIARASHDSISERPGYVQALQEGP